MRAVTIQKVKNLFKDNDDYEVLSKEYKTDVPLTIKHVSKNHIYKKTWKDLSRHPLCNHRECRNETISRKSMEKHGTQYPSQAPEIRKKISESLKAYYQTPEIIKVVDERRRIKLEKIRIFIESQGYELLSAEYINGEIELKIRHTDHTFQMDWPHFKRGQRCSNPKCMNEKFQATSMRNYGVPHPTQSAIVKAKIAETNMKRLGVPWSSMSPKVVAKQIATNLIRYGYHCPLSNPRIYQKAIETSLRKYGVPFPCQSPLIISKILRSSFSTRPYFLPSGRMVLIQGYEFRTLDMLLYRFGISEYDMNVYGLVIPYKDNHGKNRVYYPDLLLPRHNTVIETKKYIHI